MLPLANIKAAEKMAEEMAKGKCQKNYIYNPIIYRARDYTFQNETFFPPPERESLESKLKGEMQYKSIRSIYKITFTLLVHEDILVDKNGDRLVSYHIIQDLKREPVCRQQIEGNYVLMNRLRIVQSDNVTHLLKRIPGCPHEGGYLDFCFSHQNQHWHYQIISSNIQKWGKEAVVTDCQSPTWHYHSSTAGADIFLYKVM